MIMNIDSPNMRYVAVIPVKETSERVPSKNFKPFYNDKSLLDILIEKLLKVEILDHIYISTNKKDLDISHDKITVLERDEEYCNNIKPWNEVIHEIASNIPERLETQVVWCHVTTPLFDGYQEAIDTWTCQGDIYNSMVAVEKFQEFLVNEKGRAINYNHGAWFTYSQYLDPLYKITSNLFIMTLKDIINLEYFINTKPYLYKVDPMSAIDIDHPWQWDIAKILYEKKSCK